MQGNECPIHVADGVLGKQCHICAFFNGFDDQHRVLRSFIKEGFERGDRAFHIVDSELRVHGLQGLRVADASVMPTLTSGNTNTPTIMIGEKCAEIVLAAATARRGEGPAKGL